MTVLRHNIFVALLTLLSGLTSHSKLHAAASSEAEWAKTVAAVQKDGGVNDSLRIDIPKNDLRPMARRKEGAKYMVTWKAEWMDSEPMQKVVNQALAKSGRKP